MWQVHHQCWLYRGISRPIATLSVYTLNVDKNEHHIASRTIRHAELINHEQYLV